MIPEALRIQSTFFCQGRCCGSSLVLRPSLVQKKFAWSDVCRLNRLSSVTSASVNRWICTGLRIGSSASL
ncbi:hypothetical protein GOODEAATRI_016921 [Goodea atripinnis]|uniref:Uncharacterized protein n=1 Tax=Goodea atripinnis TaxID=208336 RepID=A0ABV0P5E7_9TELE